MNIKNRRPIGAEFLIRCFYTGNRKPVETVIEMAENGNPAHRTSRSSCEMVQARQIGYQGGAYRVEVHDRHGVSGSVLNKKTGSYEDFR